MSVATGIERVREKIRPAGAVVWVIVLFLTGEEFVQQKVLWYGSSVVLLPIFPKQIPEKLLPSNSHRPKVLFGWLENNNGYSLINMENGLLTFPSKRFFTRISSTFPYHTRYRDTFPVGDSAELQYVQ